MFDKLDKIIILTGNFGSGKTNLALNIARYLRREFKKVTMVDLDIVNTYFKTHDFKSITESEGIEVIYNNYKTSTIDIPSIDFDLDAIVNSDAHLVIDVGGSEVGARVLGRYAEIIKKKDHTLLYIDNYYRYNDNYIEESANLISSIEKSSRLKIKYIVNNSNLGKETTNTNIEDSLVNIHKLSKFTNKEIIFTSVKKDIVEDVLNIKNIYPVDIFVKAPWS